MPGFDSCAQLKEFSQASSPDTVLVQHMATVVQDRLARAPEPRERLDGSPPRLLLVGYTGGGNIGSDMRVLETIRQLRTLAGPNRIEFGVLAIGRNVSADICRVALIERMDRYPPHYLDDVVRRYDGVVVCEGSTFKSTFSDALSAILVGALGLAAAEGKLAIAYGTEAGVMSDALQDLVRQACGAALVICRGPPSLKILRPLVPRLTLGTDTAWLAGGGEGGARDVLCSAGWDGAAKVLVICPVNPFQWPVRTDPRTGLNAVLNESGLNLRHQSVFDNAPARESSHQLTGFLQKLALAIDTFGERRNLFPVIVGMEPLDQEACERLRDTLRVAAPVFLSGRSDVGEIISVLRSADLLVSARYHAIVLTMPWLVPSLGVAMDERVRTLFHERGQPGLCTDVLDEELTEKVLSNLHFLENSRDTVRQEIGGTVARHVKLQGEMGRVFSLEMGRIYPAWGGNGGGGWEEYLPCMPAQVAGVVQEFGAAD